MNLCIVEIKVSDMPAGRSFYTEKLGFAVKSEAYLPDVLVLEHEGVDLILHRADAPLALDYPHTAQSLLIFRTPDAEQLAADLRQKGVEILEGPRPSPPGIFLAVRDPFGNVHGFMELASAS
jgi:catechol 2,3-dioxygenase-like lactoylglutathione lyase family enzyme